MASLQFNDDSQSQLLSALNYVRLFKGTTIMIKIGGSILQDEALLKQICTDLAAIRRAGVKILLVHGGGAAINEELARRNIKWTFVEGLRVTTPEMMDVIEMVLRGQVNARLVRALGAVGLKAVGLSGADGGTVICKKMNESLGQVGVIEQIQTELIEKIFSMTDERPSGGIPQQTYEHQSDRAIPVIAPIGIDTVGNAYNVNADWVASRIASRFGVSKMIFLTDQDGILNGEGQLISELDAAELEQLIEEGAVTAGMLAKARTILHALQNQVSTVHVLNGKRAHALVVELFTDQGSGTVCSLRSRPRVMKESRQELLGHAEV